MLVAEAVQIIIFQEQVPAVLAVVVLEFGQVQE
jgi:hypothetical protein